VNAWIVFGIGMMVGGFLGIMLMALLVAARRSDDQDRETVQYLKERFDSYGNRED